MKKKIASKLVIDIVVENEREKQQSAKSRRQHD